MASMRTFCPGPPPWSLADHDAHRHDSGVCRLTTEDDDDGSQRAESSTATATATATAATTTKLAFQAKSILELGKKVGNAMTDQ